jgi:hypothetical protein
MDRIATGGDGRVDDRVDVEIGPCPTTAELIDRVGLAIVQRCRIVGRADGNGANPQITRGADDADGDLAAVGDEQRARQAHRSMVTTTRPIALRLATSKMACTDSSSG